MKLNTLFLRTIASLFVFALMLTSCEDDLQTVGGNIVNGTNFKSDSVSIPVVAYSKPFFDTQGVQTNGLSAGALGYLNDPLYGSTTASTLSQVVLSQNNPSFGENATLDSVVLLLPYYSTSALNSDGDTEYTLDSVYGNAPIKLTGYRSNYFLSDNTPPDFSEGAVYFSNQLDELSGLEGDVLFEIPEFTVSDSPIVTSEPADPDAEDQSDVLTESGPGLRMKLENLDYWQQAILNHQGEDFLFNDNSFKNYFRGVYIKTQQLGEEGTYFLFNLGASNITLYYSYDGTGEDERLQNSISLALNPSVTSRTISVLGYENSFKPEIAAELTDIDTENGEENLFLKGGQGSMAVIDLFGPDDNNDGIPERLEELRNNGWLIREADLIFNVNQTKINALGGQASNEPERVYIYNLETNEPLLDYLIDSSVGTEGAVSLKTGHLGRLERNTNGDGVRYKIRITEYLKSLLDEENENPGTKLGLVVSQNVDLVTTGIIENTDENYIPNEVPNASTLSQQGTILYGNQNSDETKRLQLKVYFSQASSN